MKKIVIGIVDSSGHAETLVLALQQAGFSPRDISVLFPDKHGTREVAVEQHSKAPEGAIAGVGVGGVVGATVGLLAGLGAIAVPGLGALIAAGPIMGVLSGVAAGAAVGGVAGALIGMGVPENAAKAYEGKLRGGKILVGVHIESADERRLAEDVMKRRGAEDVHSADEAAVPRQTV